MKKKILNKILILSGITLLLILCFLLRVHILQGIGNFLICEDELQKGDAIFVLGGDSYDRGNLAAKLFTEGYSRKIVCLGENIPTIFKALGLSYAESEVTKICIVSKQDCKESALQKEGKISIPDSSVFILKKGTSTKEEIDAIIDYCKTNNLRKIILITSKFHTRRVHMIFRKTFKEENIELVINGAASTIYSEDVWWKNEEGLIMANNEYVKLVYYFLKY